MSWCEHPPMSEVRVKIAINGVRLYRRQCVTCGMAFPLSTAEAVPYKRPGSAVPSFDETLQETYYQHVSDEATRKREQSSREWFAAYDQYLRTPEWRYKRAAVLRRERGVCQGCGGVADSVHHLTYERLRAELLFDLVAVCRSCHQRAHPNRSIT